jgi:hypothetical protein
MAAPLSTWMPDATNMARPRLGDRFRLGVLPCSGPRQGKKVLGAGSPEGLPAEKNQV